MCDEQKLNTAEQNILTHVRRIHWLAESIGYAVARQGEIPRNPSSSWDGGGSGDAHGSVMTLCEVISESLDQIRESSHYCGFGEVPEQAPAGPGQEDGQLHAI